MRALRSTSRSILAVATVVATASGLAACSAAAPANGPITMLLSTDPGSLDPAKIFGQGAQEISPFFYENLIALPDGKDPVGWLAESWTEGTTEATFVLRDGITCADGTPFTVDDVKASFDYLSNPSVGAAQFGTVIPSAGVEVTTDAAARSVTIKTLGAPDSFFAINVGQVPMICAAGLADPAALTDTPQGTGPYTLESSTAGQTYTLAHRDDYSWGIDSLAANSGTQPESIVMNVVAADATRANLLVSGEAQLALVGGSDRDRVDALSPKTRLDLPLGVGWLLPNEAPTRPLSDPDVRLAIAHAIDRDAIGSVASQNKGEPIVNLFYGSSFCVGSDSSASLPAFDTDKAATMLDAAGWTAGADGKRSKGGVPLTISVLASSEEGPSITAAMELLQQQLDAVGATVTLSTTADWVTTLLSGGDWDLVWFPVSGPVPSVWYNFFTAPPAPEGTSFTHIANLDYAAIGQQANDRVGEESCELWTEAQAALFSSADVLPTWTYLRTLYGTTATFATERLILMPSTIRVGA